MEELLSALRLYGKLADLGSDPDAEGWDRQIDNFSDAIDDYLGDLPIPASFTQDQFVTFLNGARELAWDIPSALGSLCSCEGMFNQFPMHFFSPCWPDQKPLEDLIIHHFNEVHGVD